MSLPAPDRVAPPGKWITPVLLVAIAVQFFLFLSMAVIAPVMDVLVRQPFKLNNADAAWFLKANGVATILLSLAAGWWSDRTNRRIPFLVLSLAGTGLLTACLPMIQSWPLLLSVRFLQGCFDTTAQVVLLAWLVDRTPLEFQGRSLGAVIGALPIAYMVGPALAAALGTASLLMLFGLVGAGLLACAGFVALQREGVRADGKKEAPPAAPMKWGPLVIPILFGMVDKFTFAGFALLTAPMVRDKFAGDSVEGAGILLAGFWAAFFVGLYPAVKMTERVGPPLMMGVGSILYGIVFALIGRLDFGGIMVAMAFCGILSGVMHLPALMMVGRFATEGNRGAAMGAFNLMGTLGMVIGFAVMGRLSDKSYALAWGVGGALEIIAGSLLCLLMAFGVTMGRRRGSFVTQGGPRVP